MRSALPAPHTRQAIALVIAAVACFAGLDTSTKVVSGSVSLVMVLWSRYLFQALSTTAVLLPRRGRALLRTQHPWLHALRGATLLTTSALAYFGLKHMPVGELTAIVMLTPLVITLLAVHSLGERIGMRRWAWVLGGFGGALIVIRPGGDLLGWTAAFPLGLVAANSVFQIVTSRLARTDDPGTMHFYTGWLGALVCTAMLPWAWQHISLHAWALLGLIAVFSSGGHFLLIQGYQRASAGTLTPFLYFQIAFATLGGWWVFGHAPDLATCLGILVIAVCGAGGTFWSGHRN